jgi:CubicO group peptidase (beta-lactamase class C family)
LHEQSLGQYLQANQFKPLGMTDTGFSLSPEKAARMLSDQLGPNIKTLVGNADPTRADYGFSPGLAGAHDTGRGQRAGVSGDHGVARVAMKRVAR